MAFSSRDFGPYRPNAGSLYGNFEALQASMAVRTE
jgi:hypothetical protein